MDRSDLEQQVRLSQEARVVRHAAVELFREGFTDLDYRFKPHWRAFGTSVLVQGPDPRWDWLEDAPAPGEVKVLNVSFGFTAASMTVWAHQTPELNYKNFNIDYANPDYPNGLLLRINAELVTHMLRLEADREEYRLFAADCRRRGIGIIQASDVPPGRFGSWN